MGTGEEQQQQQEGVFQREVDAAEKSLAVVMVAVRRRFKLFFCNSSVRNLQGERL